MKLRSMKLKELIKIIESNGWVSRRNAGGSHIVLSKPGASNYVVACHDNQEIGPKMVARIIKRTGIDL